MEPTGALGWPDDPAALAALQDRLAALTPPPWEPRPDARVGASYCCFARGGPGPGGAGERGWGGAVCKEPGHRAVVAVAEGVAAAPYLPGMLARREGPLREAAVRRLAVPPEVLLVDATGRDHPRRAGLALHLGAVLGIPTVGATERPLTARGDPPGAARGASSPLLIDGDVVGHWLRTRPGARPVAVHAAWRTSPDVAVAVVLSSARRARTPQPLREARRAARHARDASR